MRHVIWDWNGTLLDDLAVVIRAVNHSIAPFGIPPIDADSYRLTYTRPVHVFYERLFERPVDAAEFAEIDRTFHGVYSADLAEVGLSAGARQALDGVAARGWTQSLLSMAWHDDLLAQAMALEVTDHMLAIDGHRGVPGDTKSRHLGEHLRRLSDLHHELGAPVMVGDIGDDADAAAAAGIECVLYDGGSQPRELLEARGVPVVDSLVEVVEVIAAGS